MCTAIQAISRSEAGVPRSGKSPQRCASEALAPRAFGVICGGRIFCANGAGEKMRINLTNGVDIWRDFDALKACPYKCAAPVICSQEAGVRAKFRICLDLGKAFQNLKH